MTIIKNGTIVTADLSYKADVRVEGGKITEIGQNLSGGDVLDATGCYVMPGGIDPHTHLEMPFMGTYSTDDFESRHARGAARRHHDGGRFLPAQPQPVAARSAADVGQQDVQGVAATTRSTWRSPGGASRCSTRWPRSSIAASPRFKHFMAYKGSLMVNDDEMFASFQRCAELGALPLVHAENGDVVAAMTQKLLAEGNNGPEGHAYSRPPEVEGEATNRAIMIADMAGVPLYVVHTSLRAGA